jgi:hypothetical protein
MTSGFRKIQEQLRPKVKIRLFTRLPPILCLPTIAITSARFSQPITINFSQKIVKRNTNASSVNSSVGVKNDLCYGLTLFPTSPYTFPPTTAVLFGRIRQ